MLHEMYRTFLESQQLFYWITVRIYFSVKVTHERELNGKLLLIWKQKQLMLGYQRTVLVSN